MQKSVSILTLIVIIFATSCSSSTESTTQFQVTLNSSPSEGGTVSPATDDHDEGTSLDISATANEGWSFARWTGDHDGTDQSTTITVDADKNITAIFEKKSYNLTVTTEGEGTVDENIVQTKATEYEHGTIVELTANPDTGWEFVEWTGDMTGTDNPQEITVDEAKNVTAVFAKQSYALTINTTGQGTVTKNPDQSTYEYGTVVEITATPDNDWAFEEWHGAETGNNNPIQITIDSVKELTAVFTENATSLFYLADNGVTIKCEDAYVGDTGEVNGITYTKRSANQIYPINANEVAATTCTSDITDMSSMFYRASDFNADISHWDVSSVRDMSQMFDIAYDFNADLSYWDVSNVKDMSRMFYNARSFNSDISGWDVSSVTNMSEMFADAFSFNQNLNSWDVSSVTNIWRMFYRASAFNGDISSWNVSGITSLSEVFMGATAFNSDISNWDVSNVTTLYQTFASASAFNSDISNWDVSSVMSMRGTFASATSFNSSLNGWDVSNVGNMRAMFSGAESFNQDINDWNVSSVTDMRLMFYDATAFNQDLGNWDVSGVTTMYRMFWGATSFDGYISNWDVSLVGNMDQMFLNATAFNQNLSGWCVSQFGSQVPSGFAHGSGLDNANLPVWGTCPGS